MRINCIIIILFCIHNEMRSTNGIIDGGGGSGSGLRIRISNNQIKSVGSQSSVFHLFGGLTFFFSFETRFLNNDVQIILLRVCCLHCVFSKSNSSTAANFLVQGRQLSPYKKLGGRFGDRG